MTIKNMNAWILVCLILVLVACIFLFNTPYRWSRNLQKAIQSADNQKAMALIDEGIERGYSLDTLSERASSLWTFLEHVPETPLQVACKEGNYAVAERLLQEGASVRSMEGGAGREPIFCVLLRSYNASDAQLIQLLIDHGAVLDYSDYYLMLEAASRSTYSQSTESDAFLYDEEVAKGITEVFLILAQYSDCYVTDSANRNALHYAAIYENWILIEVLTSSFDYSLDAEDCWGNTAYDLAAENAAPIYILELLES